MKYSSIFLVSIIFIPFLSSAKIIKKSVQPTPPPVEIIDTPTVVPAPKYKIDGIYSAPYLRNQAYIAKVSDMIASYIAKGNTLPPDTQALSDAVNQNTQIAQKYVDELSSIKTIDKNATFFISKQQTISSLHDVLEDSNKKLHQIVISIYKSSK